MKTLRAGLAGLGMMGRNHARVLDSLPGVELVAIADHDPKPAAAPRGIRLVRDVEELLAIGVDYVVIALPTDAHESSALACCAAGVPCLIEKPLGLDPDTAGRIADAFAAAGVLGAVGHIERYNPALRECRRKLADGTLGDVYQVATRRQGPFPGRIQDVGVVNDLGTHDFDITSWITGRSYVSVAAQIQNRSGSPHEDLVAITARLSGGLVANHLINWLSPFKERVVVVTGERGALVADTLTADLTLFRNGAGDDSWEPLALFRGVSEGDMIRFALSKYEPLRAEHEAFRDAVAGRPSEVVTLAEGLATVRIAEAVLESARLGESLPIRAARLDSDDRV